MENEDKKKSKKNKSWILGLLLGGAAIGGGTTAVVVNQNKGPQDGEMVVEQSVVSNFEAGKQEEKENIILFTQDEVDKLKGAIKEATENLDEKSPFIGERVWNVQTYTKEHEDYNDQVMNDLKALYEDINGNVDEESEDNGDDNDNPFSGVSNNHPTVNGSNKDSRLGDNNTASDKLESDKVVCIGFNYGSYLDGNGDMYIANFLKGNKKIKTSRDIEYADICMAINDIISEIPAGKRDKAVFAVIGYTDTSFRNGVSNKGDESKIFNTQLSKKRAESIKKILEEHGYDSKHIKTDGKRFDNLLYNDGFEDHEKSRRVEVFCYAK